MVSCLKRRSLLFNPSVEPEVYFNRADLKKWFQKFLNDLTPINMKVIALFYGEKDAGKTHFLKYAQSQLIKRGKPFAAYIDVRKTASEFDFYLRIIESFSRFEFLEDFLNEISQVRDIKTINELCGGNRIGVISKQLNFDPEQINQWIHGKLSRSPHRWMYLVNEDANIARASLSELLRAFFKMNNRSYPIFLIDNVGDLLCDPPRNYMNEKSREETIKHVVTLGDRANILLSLDKEDYAEYRRQFTSFQSSEYCEFELHHLDDESFEKFFSELRNFIVDEENLNSIDLVPIPGNEKVSKSTFPLTEECKGFIRNMQAKQPGLVLKILNQALELSWEKSQSEMLTKSLVLESVKEIEPRSLIVCENCHLKLDQIDIELFQKLNQPGTIIAVNCFICNKPVNKLLPLVLDRIVVDTCALVDNCVSSLFDYLPDLGKSRPITIFITKAVNSELAHWEKVESKWRESRSALNEKRRIYGFKNRGKVYVEENIGRESKRFEKISAQYSNSIDRIIMEMAKTLNATLITCDKLMADEARTDGIFSLLFSKQNPQEEYRRPGFNRRF